MIITSITVRNFRGIRELSLDDLPDQVLVLGLNRSGKTSLLDALRAVFLGRIQDHAGRALEVREWIGPHESTAAVAVGFELLDGAYTARMRVARTVSLEIQPPDGKPLWTGAPKDVRGALWRHLGVAQRHRECAMTPRAYLVGDDLGKMISDLGGGGVDQAELDAILGDDAAWFHGFAAAEKITPASPDALLSLGEAMFQKRTSMKANLAALTAQAERSAGVMPPTGRNGATLTPAQIPAVESALAQIRATRDTLLAERGAAENAAGSAEALERARSERARIRLEELEGAVEEASGRRDQARKTMEPMDAALRNALAADSAAVDALARASVSLDAAKAAVASLDGLSACCPTCGQKIAPAARKSMAEPLDTALAEAAAAHTAAQDRRQQTLAAIQPARDRAKAAAETLRQAEREVSDAAARLNEHRGRASALDRQIAELETLAGSAPRALEDVDADIQATEAKTEAAVAALETLRTIADRERTETARDQVAAEVEVLTRLIPLFHNDRRSNHASALNRLARNEQEAFLSACNDRLEPFGLALGLDTSGKSVAVTLRSLDQDLAVPVTQASGAEMLLAEWAVATAFAGDGLVLLDEFTRLDGRYRGLLLESLAARPGSLWVASAYSHEGEPEVESLRDALAPLGVVWMRREGDQP